MTITEFLCSLTSQTIIISSFFVLLGGFFLLLSRKIYRDYFSPLGLMGSMWNWAIAVANLQLSPIYQRTWRAETWIVVLGSFITFTIGCLTLTLLYLLKKKNGSTISRSWNKKDLKLRISKRTFTKVIYFLFIISYIAFLYQVFRIAIIGGGLDAFIKTPHIAEREFWVTGVGYIYYLNFFNAVLAYAYLEIYGIRRNKIIAGIFLLSLFAWPFRMNKTVIFIGVASIFFLANYLREHQFSLRYLLLVLLILLLVFIGYSSVTPYENVEYVEKGAVKLPQSLALLARPYLYLSTSFENLQEALIQDRNTNYIAGIRTFYPVLNFTLINDIFNIREHLKAERPMYNFAFKTNTYLGHYYLDFGVLGTLIIPYLLGLLTTFIYIKMLRKGSPFFLFSYVYIAYAIAFAFFAPYFSGSVIWYMIGASFFLDLAIKRKQGKERERKDPSHYNPL